MEVLASIILATKSKEEVKNDESTPEPTVTPPPMSTTFVTSAPGYNKLASLALEPEGAITLRARVVHLQHLSNDEKAEHVLYNTLHQLVQRFSDKNGPN